MAAKVRLKKVVRSGIPVRVPRAIGMNRKDAEKTWRAANLAVGHIRWIRWLPAPGTIKG